MALAFAKKSRGHGRREYLFRNELQSVAEYAILYISTKRKESKMASYGDLDYGWEPGWEAEDELEAEGYSEYDEPSEPRPYWNGVPH